MTRPSVLTREYVLAEAIKIFSIHGYERASIGELAIRVGVPRRALAGVVGDKHQLYLDALRSCGEDNLATVSRSFASAASCRRGLGDALLDVVSRSSALMFGGCLEVGAVWEHGRSDPAVNAIAESADRALLKRLEDCIEAGKAAGEFAADVSVRQAAVLLKASLVAMKVAARAGASRATLRGIAQAALSSIPPPMQ